MDSYPTYHDAPDNTLAGATGTRPTDPNLPQSRRTSGRPILIGVVAFAAVVLIYVMWSLFNMGQTTDDAMTPGDAATPAATDLGAPTVPGTAIDTSEAPATGEPALDTDVQPATGSPAPGSVPATPGAIDVPGTGSNRDPVPPGTTNQ